jgi:hypothetical protein
LLKKSNALKRQHSDGQEDAWFAAHGSYTFYLEELSL